MDFCRYKIKMKEINDNKMYEKRIPTKENMKNKMQKSNKSINKI